MASEAAATAVGATNRRADLNNFNIPPPVVIRRRDYRRGDRSGYLSGRRDELLRPIPDGRNVGYRQIVRGLADARYDSGGYGTHPRRAKYRAADARYPDKTCPPVSPPPPPPPPPPPAPGCDPSYPDFCIPPPPPDLDCADIGTSFTVVGSDPHGFDADGDGTGCDSYG